MRAMAGALVALVILVGVYALIGLAIAGHVR